MTSGIKVIVSQNGDLAHFFSSNESFIYYLSLIKIQLLYWSIQGMNYSIVVKSIVSALVLNPTSLSLCVVGNLPNYIASVSSPIKHK